MLEQEILQELQKLNTNVEKQNKLGIRKSFLNGFLYSLGNAFGTLLIGAITLYIVSLFSSQIIKSTTTYVESIMQNINWQKIIPQPKLFELPSNFNLKDF